MTLFADGNKQPPTLSYTYIKTIRQSVVIMMHWGAAELTLVLCVTDPSAQGACAREDTAVINTYKIANRLFV